METVTKPRDIRLSSLISALQREEKQAVAMLDKMIADAVEEKTLQIIEQANSSQGSLNNNALIKDFTNIVKSVHQDNLNNLNNVYSPLVQQAHSQLGVVISHNAQNTQQIISSLTEQIKFKDIQIEKANETIRQLIQTIR